MYANLSNKYHCKSTLNVSYMLFMYINVYVHVHVHVHIHIHVYHVPSSPGTFSMYAYMRKTCALKSWEWPGDEAIHHIIIIQYMYMYKIL